MCAALVGGMDRLKREYAEAANALGIRLKVFNGKESDIAGRIGKADRIILFTGKVSHKARAEALRHATRCNIPVSQCHACGVSSLRQCLADMIRDT